MTAAEKVSVRSGGIGDQVRGLILGRIIDGRWPAGTHLKQAVIAQELKVSQTPVREALRELAAIGLLEAEPHRGMRVRGINIPELKESYALRAVIEEASALNAVPCEPADLAALEDNLEAMRGAQQSGNTADYMDASYAFHWRIVRMSRNGVFLRAWEQMAWDVRARLAAHCLGFSILFTDQRHDVVAALKQHDGPRAARLVKDICNQIIGLLDRSGSALN